MNDVSVDSIISTTPLQRFLTWFSVAVLVFAGSDFIGWFVWATPDFLIFGALGLFISILSFGARQLVRRGHVSLALWVIGITLFLITFGVVLTSPFLLPDLVLLPILNVALALLYVGGRTLRSIVGFSWVSTVSVSIISIIPSETISAYDKFLIVGGVAVVTALTLGLLWQARDRLATLVQQTRQANTALQEAQATLEAQVVDRTAELQTALAEVEQRAAAQARLLAEVQQQRVVIQEMSVPVLPVTHSTLVMPLIGTLDSYRLDLVQTQALAAIESRQARHLVLDITGVPVVDSQVAQGLLYVVQAVRLLGATVTLVGIRPEVAQALVGLGIAFPGMRTTRDLQAALNGMS